MKKLIIGAALLAATFAHAETVRVIERNKDGTSVTNSYDAVAYAQKLVEQKAASKWRDGWEQPNQIILFGATTPAVQAQIDALLAAHMFYTSNAHWADTYPALFANFAKIYTTKCPELVPLTTYIVANPDAWDAKVKTELINAYFGLFKYHLISDGMIRKLLNVSPVAIKHKIRSEGRSFVAKDGVNPVQIRVDKLSSALNAPRLSGLNAAFQACGMDCGLDFEAQLLPEEEIAKLRTKVLNGDTELKDDFVGLLRTHLGIDAYNQFIKLYNEGE